MLLQAAVQAFHAVRKDSTGLNLVISAVEKYNTAARLLSRIVSFLREEWHPDASFPTLDKENLDKSIEIASKEIQKLIDFNDKAKTDDAAKTGSLHQLGKTAETICVNLKPVFKTILSVAIQGSAVRSRFWGELIYRSLFSIPTDYYAVDSRYSLMYVSYDPFRVVTFLIH